MQDLIMEHQSLTFMTLKTTAIKFFSDFLYVSPHHALPSIPRIITKGYNLMAEGNPKLALRFRNILSSCELLIVKRLGLGLGLGWGWGWESQEMTV